MIAIFESLLTDSGIELTPEHWARLAQLSGPLFILAAKRLGVEHPAIAATSNALQGLIYLHTVEAEIAASSGGGEVALGESITVPLIFTDHNH